MAASRGVQEGSGKGLYNHSGSARLGERRIVMKTITLATLALIEASFVTIPALAAPLSPGMANQGILNVASGEFSGMVQVVEKNRKRELGLKLNFGIGGFNPGYVLTPYGYRDCRGWWHQHSDGTYHCHGVLASSKIRK
jgi:hypothetical protein